MGLIDEIMAPIILILRCSMAKSYCPTKTGQMREKIRNPKYRRHIIPLHSVRPAPVHDKINLQLAKMEQDIQKWTDCGRL